MSDGDTKTPNEPESTRKLFLGGLDYSTTEDGLRAHFEKYGGLVDVVVMRFPDTKRSRGFGFITYSTAAEADAAFEDRPHTIDTASIETKRATPREEMNKAGSGSNSETHRKLFIGGLNYSTTDDALKEYFSKYGELVDCVVMKFRDTKRSRGFGFVTYATIEMVDECQNNRPHTIDGTKVETKRATPRDDNGPGSGQTVQKLFLGGLKDGVTDDNLRDYFGKFGTVTNVEQMTDKSNGRKRGFGFVEFDDYDPVDKCLLEGNNHMVNGFKIDVKKAISKNEMNHGMGGGGPRGGPSYDRGQAAPWHQDGGYGGGNRGGFGGGRGGRGGGGGFGGGRGRGGGGGNQNYGGGWGNDGGYGNNSGYNSGGGGGWGQNHGNDNGGMGGMGGPDPWGSQGGGNNSGWGEDPGWLNNTKGGNSGNNSGWGNNSGGGWGNNSGGNGNGGWDDGGYGGGYGGNQGGGGGGPMRGNNYNMGNRGGQRSAPYSVGRGGGASGYSGRGGNSGRW